jgi:hypothetical protein
MQSLLLHEWMQSQAQVVVVVVVVSHESVMR